MSLESISEALNHSEVTTTKAYINANNVIELTPADFSFNHLAKSNSGELVWNLVGISEKKHLSENREVLEIVDMNGTRFPKKSPSHTVFVNE